VTDLPQTRRLARGANKIASVPPHLLQSALSHDELWIFANRILANWICRRRRGRLL